ncbi:aminotransferase class I/II-fold pyridoxal phosphate-dependent enzyme [Alphaproteobacteria bacterium]|nr:aminotransferase class I/II-fold pyridoxal phosphate-dependent enzyme [Alphaproteobacteria bacterium]
MIKYPYSKPEVTKSDILEVKKVMEGGYLSQGDKIQEFEFELAKNFKSQNVIVCNSGTAALHLIYMALGLGPKSGLLTSPITFLATANAAKMCNAPVIFADVDNKSGLLTADTIEYALKKSKYRIKVITLVHLGGKICDLESIAAVAKEYNCLIVEDASHAPGAYYYYEKSKKSKIGSNRYSIASTFSFNAIKHIAMGEGGGVSTNDLKIANKIRSLRSHGMLRNKEKFLYKQTDNAPWYYEMHELGWNYRADEIQCALGLSQLNRLQKGIIKRKKLVSYYLKELKDVDSIILPAYDKSIDKSVWHLYPILIDFKKIGISRSKIMELLLKSGIQTQVHYIPLFLQPFYRERNISFYKGAMSYYESTLSLPLYVQLSKKDIIFISSKIKSIILNG